MSINNHKCKGQLMTTVANWAGVTPCELAHQCLSELQYLHPTHNKLSKRGTLTSLLAACIRPQQQRQISGLTAT